MKKNWLIAVATLLLLPIICFLVWKPALLEDVSFSRAVFDRNGQLLRLTLAQDQSYRLFVPLKDISPQLKEAVLLHEDQHFYIHVGVNPISVIRAFFHTYVAGGRRIGASTLTMQLARIKYHIDSHSAHGKLLQIVRALQLEAHYSKDQLFEAYLNLAPYGYNINGAGTASFIYFHTQPKDLTLPEALTLAVLPQSPARREPESGKPSKAALNEARNRLFTQWVEDHPKDKDQKLFFALPLSVYGIKDLPFEAPHLTHELLEKSKDGQITSTIDLGMQHLLEDILHKYIIDRHNSGIQNASAILVDTRTMEVKTLIGSADFFNKSIDGEVDGTRARRSPGSTLKPFIYAMAMDQGIIHPASILSDAPVSYGSYTPDNFDNDFRGPVKARDALRMSRNIPAIHLAAQLHSPDLYDFLKEADIKGLKDKKSYGLSIVLGGAEVTQQELIGLYAMLANDGILKPLSFQLPLAAKISSGESLISPEASFMTLDMLADTPRPYSIDTPLKVYWKTGTSNGYRDAWTAGIFGHYALVVWVGNFNNKGNPAFVGGYAAAPLFFTLVDAIQGKEPQQELIAGKAAHLNIRKIDICATTGDIYTKDCPVKDKTWFMPGKSPIAQHDIYRKILVDTTNGKRACHMSTTTTWKTFEVWPSNLQQTLQKAGINMPPLPPYEPGCDDALATKNPDAGEKPVILSPQPKVEYHARIDDPSEAVNFTANADGDVHTLSWFLDDTYLGNSAPGTPLFWQPQPGMHTVHVIDDHGRTDTTKLRVVLLQ